MIVRYKTFSDMANTIRLNLWKIPRNIDVVIGVPRSGMIAASMIAELLGKPLTDEDSFSKNQEVFPGGDRSKFMKPTNFKRVLVVDDTVHFGVALNRTRKKFANITNVEFIYLTVYVERQEAKNLIDISLEDLIDVGNFGKEWLHFFEWNIYHYHPMIMERILFDCDGCLCLDPPCDSNLKAYEEYLPKAIPLHTLTNKIGGIITFRCECYKEITEKWLAEHGIEYNNLIMAPYSTIEERNKNLDGAEFKPFYYKNTPWAVLFVESNDYEARKIAELTKKPVLCNTTNKLY